MQTLLAIMSLFITMEQTCASYVPRAPLALEPALTPSSSHAVHPAIVTVGAIWLFQATTEQSVFIGLLMCASLSQSLSSPARARR